MLHSKPSLTVVPDILIEADGAKLITLLWKQPEKVSSLHATKPVILYATWASCHVCFGCRVKGRKVMYLLIRIPDAAEKGLN